MRAAVTAFVLTSFLFGFSIDLQAKHTADALNSADHLAGHVAELAIPSVFRIIVPSKDRIGTGFLHKSGYIITAGHVLQGCFPQEIFILDLSGQRVSVHSIVINSDLDLALVKINSPIQRKSLPLSMENNFKIGSQVSIWGFPEGYAGKIPLVMAGYLSGLDNDQERLKEGKVISRWVINAAFNNGNSGSPLIDIETGKVMGVVISKLAPVPPTIANALEALKNQHNGFVYTAKNEQGVAVNLSEAQIVELVLQYLRSQTQLVIGEAVTIDNLRDFLKSQKIAP